MSQTSAIAASLIAAFLVFITVRGELPAYLSIFSGTAPKATSTAVTSTSTTIATPGLGIKIGG